MRQSLETGLLIGLGAVIGANLRYVISSWIVQQTNGGFPWGTFLVNFTGSLGLALFLAWFSQRAHLDSRMMLLIATGFFGAYTTYSTFASESVALARSGEWLRAAGYIVGTNLACILGALAGIAIGIRL